MTLLMTVFDPHKNITGSISSQALGPYRLGIHMPVDRRVIKKPSAMKRPTSSATRFIPKRGIARMVTRKPASRPGYVRRVAYTRVARPSTNRKRDSQPSVRLLDLLKGTKWTTNHLLSHGFLKVPDRCDVCGHRREAFTKGKRHGARSQARCSSYQRKRRLSIFTGNPFFTTRAPAVSVMNQAAILYNLCIGVSKIHTHTSNWVCLMVPLKDVGCDLRNI